MKTQYILFCHQKVFASILYKDSSKAKDAAENMKLTAKELKKLGIIDDIIKEPQGGAQENFEQTKEEVKKYIVKNIKSLENYIKENSIEDLIEKRYQKFRNM